METYKIGKEKIQFYGKYKGANTNKFNRVAKLAAMYNELNKKLHGMAERGKSSCSETYRCAVALLLIMETGIRVGNEGSAEGYNTVPHPHNKDQSSKFVKTYGLTTLQWQHCDMQTKEFEFLGKKQVNNTFKIPETTWVYIHKLWCGLREEQVFNKRIRIGDELIFGISDYQLTKFIKKYVGKQFSPKDFRTLRANIYAYQSFKSECRFELPETKKEAKLLVKDICTDVSEMLNNTPGVCKKSYIDDMLFTTEFKVLTN